MLEQCPEGGARLDGAASRDAAGDSVAAPALPAKRSARRLRDIARCAIPDRRSAQRASRRRVGAPASARRTRERLLWVAALVVAVAAVAAGTALGTPPARGSPDEVRLELNDATDDGSGLVGGFAGREDSWCSWPRPRDNRALAAAPGRRSARPLAGTENARLPFWSPDSRSVGFSADGQLKRVDIDSGSVRHWLRRSKRRRLESGRHDPLRSRYRVIAVPSLRRRRRADRSTCRPPSQLIPSSPQFLPDGRHFLFLRERHRAPGVYIGQLGATGHPRRILEAQAATYARPGISCSFVRARCSRRHLIRRGWSSPATQSRHGTDVGHRRGRRRCRRPRLAPSCIGRESTRSPNSSGSTDPARRFETVRVPNRQVIQFLAVTRRPPPGDFTGSVAAADIWLLDLNRACPADSRSTRRST